MPNDEEIAKGNCALTSLSRKLSTACGGFSDETREALSGWEQDIREIRAGLGATFTAAAVGDFVADRVDVSLAGMHTRVDAIERTLRALAPPQSDRYDVSNVLDRIGKVERLVYDLERAHDTTRTRIEASHNGIDLMLRTLLAGKVQPSKRAKRTRKKK